MLSSAARPFLRHIARCHDADLPGGRLPLLYRDDRIGWVTPRILESTHGSAYLRDGALRIEDGREFLALGEVLAADGLYTPHDELFDVRDSGGVVIGRIDRGAIPLLGVFAEGVHVNGLVETASGTHLWIARRSMNKRLDPGKLDHLVAGGMNTGLTPMETLVKEAEEEAGIGPDLAGTAIPVSKLRYALERAEGLRRDLLHCYDITLPQDFTPRAVDGEVESFHLMPLRDVFARVRDTDDFKFNVNLVLIDLFIRRSMFTPEDGALLSHALYGAA